MSLYKQALYYEIAFGFINAREQVDNFEKLIDTFSRIKVKRFLDIACGTSLQLREIAKRGYEAVGLDISPEMLTYLQKRAREEGVKIETIQADMCNFRLSRKADFAFIMMGSIEVESNERFLTHLDSVAHSLNNGGLYFIQNKAVDWTQTEKQSWTIKKDDITVKTTFSTRVKDIFHQIVTENLVMEVNDHGEEKKFTEEENLKFIFPQEFKALIQLNGKFELLGWWKGNCNTWHLDQLLDDPVNLSGDNMVLLRRKEPPLNR